MKKICYATLLILAVLFLQQSQAQTNWFVNDNSTSLDVYCMSVGDDANPGTSAQPFRTIQKALDVASNGDYIYVDEGSYTETFFINKSVTLRGAKFGVAAGPATNPMRGTGESIIYGTVEFGQTVDNITMDGFQVEMGTNQYGIRARGLNSKILNNIVNATLNITVIQCGLATRANGPLRLHSYEIKNNRVTGARYGLYFDGNLESPSEIFNNYISNAFSSGMVLTGSGGHHYKNNTIEFCATGMTVRHGNLLIEQNTIRNCVTAGIRIYGSSLVQNNMIVHNFIMNNTTGISMTNDEGTLAENNKVHYNSLTSNITNISNVQATLLDAACNWHGTNNITTVAGLVSGDVRYSPIIENGTDLDPVEPGFQPEMFCIIVPVKWDRFYASVQENDVTLHWTTQTEINNSHFAIQRSTNGIEFATIGYVESAGNSTTITSYEFNDVNALQYGQTLYYRLQQFDNDGSTSFSEVITVRLRTDKYVQVFPNPAKDVLNVRMQMTGEKQYRLTDLQGNVLMQGKTSQMQMQLAAKHLKSGMYILTVVDERGQKTAVRVNVLN